MAGTPVRILLARHGETHANVEGRWQGQTDSPLTDRGWQQAELLADMLATRTVDAVYSSPIGRAMQTAEVVAARHNLPIIPDDRLKEIDCGGWTGRLGADLRVEDPEGMDAWAHRPWAFRMPGGETLGETQARGLAFFQNMMAQHAGETVAVITHGAMTQTIVIEGMGQTIADLWLEGGRIENCQVSTLEWTPEGGLRLLDLGDASHLASVGTLGGWRTVDQDVQEQRS
jgi:broad specificity phosphatase PhoE